MKGKKYPKYFLGGLLAGIGGQLLDGAISGGIQMLTDKINAPKIKAQEEAAKAEEARLKQEANVKAFNARPIVQPNMGGNLNLYRKGGKPQKKNDPIIVNDKKDPRLKAYQDSLYSYNITKKYEGKFPVVSNEIADKITGLKTTPDPMGHMPIGWYEKPSDNPTLPFPTFSPKYKKPVQPVIYKKPEPAPTPPKVSLDTTPNPRSKEQIKGSDGTWYDIDSKTDGYKQVRYGNTTAINPSSDRLRSVPVMKEGGKVTLKAISGPKHENGGVPLKDKNGKVIGEVEGGETKVVKKGQPEFIFSDSIMLPGSNMSFADASKKIGSDKQGLEQLAQMQESMKGDTGMKTYLKRGGKPKYFLGGGPFDFSKLFKKKSILDAGTWEDPDMTNTSAGSDFSLLKGLMTPTAGKLPLVPDEEELDERPMRSLLPRVGESYSSSRPTTKDKAKNIGKQIGTGLLNAGQILAPIAATAYGAKAFDIRPDLKYNEGFDKARNILPKKFSLEAARQDAKTAERNTSKAITASTSSAANLKSNLLANRARTTSAYNDISMREGLGQNQLDTQRATLEVQAGGDRQAVDNQKAMLDAEAKFGKRQFIAQGIGTTLQNIYLTRRDRKMDDMNMLESLMIGSTARGNEGATSADWIKKNAGKLGERLGLKYGGATKRKKYC